MNHRPYAVFVSEFLDKEFGKLHSEKVEPWAFFNSVGVDVEGYNGKRINTSGIQFSGTIRDLYWNSYIQPFVLDIISRAYQFAGEFAVKHNYRPRLPIYEMEVQLYRKLELLLQRMRQIDGILISETKEQPYDTQNIQNSLKDQINKRSIAEVALFDRKVPGTWLAAVWWFLKSDWKWVVTTLIALAAFFKK